LLVNGFGKYCRAERYQQYCKQKFDVLHYFYIRYFYYRFAKIHFFYNTKCFFLQKRSTFFKIAGLKCLYTTVNGVKTYSKEWGSEAMMKGVMETISYHFKPQMFRDSEHKMDIEAIVDMLPKVHGKVLYRKFGVLHGEKSLNVKDNTLIADYEETTEDVDEETGEVFETQYFITNPINVYAKGVNLEIALSKRSDVRIQVLKAHSGREAVQQLNGYLVKNKL